ncbi:hypothetical protein [Saccharolobus islandicus]|uniref:hypothetical protein n=1 Tax=Saccharolobus islandicus TaxID=43080 RepID=UPI0012671B7F|nr:hypothetical protein [Sulfolobus islandicus]
MELEYLNENKDKLSIINKNNIQITSSFRNLYLQTLGNYPLIILSLLIISLFIILFNIKELLLWLFAIYLIFILAPLGTIYLPLFLYDKLILNKIFDKRTMIFSLFKVQFNLINENNINEYKLCLRNYVTRRKLGILISGFLVTIIQDTIFLIPNLIGDNIMTESYYYFALVIIIIVLYPALYFIVLLIRKFYIYTNIIYQLFKKYNINDINRLKKKILTFLVISLLSFIIIVLLYVTIRYLYAIILAYSKQFTILFTHLINLQPLATLLLFLTFTLLTSLMLWYLIDILDTKGILIIIRKEILKKRT